MLHPYGRPPLPAGASGIWHPLEGGREPALDLRVLYPFGRPSRGVGLVWVLHPFGRPSRIDRRSGVRHLSANTGLAIRLWDTSGLRVVPVLQSEPAWNHECCIPSGDPLVVLVGPASAWYPFG